MVDNPNVQPGKIIYMSQSTSHTRQLLQQNGKAGRQFIEGGIKLFVEGRLFIKGGDCLLREEGG